MQCGSPHCDLPRPRSGRSALLQSAHRLLCTCPCLSIVRARRTLLLPLMRLPPLRSRTRRMPCAWLAS